MSENNDFQQLLQAGRAGDRTAREMIFSQVYAELKRVAMAQLRRSGRAITMSPSTLVHEAYLKFARSENYAIEDKRHFFNLLAQAMRQILVDLIRRKETVRHGSGFLRTTLDEELHDQCVSQEEILTIDKALTQLEERDSDLAELVKLHFFGGFSLLEIAQAQGKGERTIRRHWEIARALLLDLMSPQATGEA